MEHNHQGGPGRSRARRLLLCLDGVPYKLIEEAKARGLFSSFNRPTHLLSPFPTMTNVALSAMFAASPPAGYESLYFDRTAGELRGGIRKYLGRRTPDKIPSSYMDDLDYQEPLAFEFLIYVAPDRVWQADMRRFHERFRLAPQTRDYFAFLKGTDGLLHTQGPERLNIALESLDRILNEIQEWCGNETEIVLFSDHGMNLEENQRVNLLTGLRSHGVTVLNKLAGNEKRAVSVPTFGLCSYAAAYCSRTEDIEAVADVMTEVKGVDFVVLRDEASVVLKSSRGSARIDQRVRDEIVSYRYLSQEGDPLQLASVSNLVGTGEFDSDRSWFDRTKSHKYPDALANVYNSLFAPRVKHTADILISLSDGYYYGWSPFGRFVRLAATHGNAMRASSNAFLMSTHREFPEYVRADDARNFLKE
jgi:hypothetical protein